MIAPKRKMNISKGFLFVLFIQFHFYHQTSSLFFTFLSLWILLGEGAFSLQSQPTSPTQASLQGPLFAIQVLTAPVISQ